MLRVTPTGGQVISPPPRSFGRRRDWNVTPARASGARDPDVENLSKIGFDEMTRRTSCTEPRRFWSDETPSGEYAGAAIDAMRRTVRPIIAGHFAVVGVLLAWGPCGDQLGAARSARCHLYVSRHRTDRRVPRSTSHQDLVGYIFSRGIVGQHMRDKIDPETFKKLVLIVVIAAGAELARHGFFS